MKILKKTAMTFPILISLAVTGLFIALLSYSHLFLQYIPWGLEGSEFRYQLLGETVTSLFAIIIILLFGLKYVLKRKGTGFFKGLIPCLYVLATLIYSGILQISNSLFFGHELAGIGDILVFLATMVLIGITEEFIFRGFIAEIIFQKYAYNYSGVWFSVIVSGIIFGFMHMSNAASVDNTASVLIQSLSATAIGMTYCAIFYRTRNVWVCVFLHFLNNLFALAPAGIFKASSISESLGSYTSVNLIGIIPYIIVTAVLLRPEKANDLFIKKQGRKFNFTYVNVALGVILFSVAAVTAFMLLPETIEYFKEIIQESMNF